MKQDLKKMLRRLGCERLKNHEFKVIKQDSKQTLSECIHCKEWLLERTK